MRLQRYIAQSGVASRRHAEELIASGRVKVNGKIIKEMGVKVDPERDAVEVEGKRVHQQQHVYVVLNKPKGCVSTVSDPEGRPTVMACLPKGLPAHVKPVGRLDFYTEGVLLFTNDGDLHAALLAPKKGIEKTYHVKLKGAVSKEQIEQLRAGVRLPPRRREEDEEEKKNRARQAHRRPSPGPERRVREKAALKEKSGPAKVDTLKFTGVHTWLVISIAEGKSRQIHRMAEAVGLQVLKLQRVAFAGITYYGLKVGESRALQPDEVLELRELAGLG